MQFFPFSPSWLQNMTLAKSCFVLLHGKICENSSLLDQITTENVMARAH